MSAQDSNLSNPVRYRKPKADIYTLLLGIALGCADHSLYLRVHGDKGLWRQPVFGSTISGDTD